MNDPDHCRTKHEDAEEQRSDPEPWRIKDEDADEGWRVFFILYSNDAEEY